MGFPKVKLRDKSGLPTPVGQELCGFNGGWSMDINTCKKFGDFSCDGFRSEVKTSISGLILPHQESPNF